MRPGLSTLVRDTATWVGGWVIIFKQAGIGFAPPSQVSETLIWMAGALIGVPGIMQVWQGVRSGQSGQQTGTGASPPSAPSPGLPPSSAGASSGGEP
jgi:hypothetical protein